MSGDVQPRKRKDKKRKKDELGVEEPRGTAAALGEGDVFIHSHHDHGTGGHWCAKIIFFSLLAVLITLIGLIILENRGLTELEANSVESRYSGVLEGWLEDAPEDNHHDEHTLELNHPDDEDEHDDGELNEHDDDDEDQELDHDQEDEHDSENDEDEDELNHSDNDDENADADQDLEDSDEDNDDDDEDEQDHSSSKYYEDEDKYESDDGHDKEEKNDYDDNREEENDDGDDREEENDDDDDREEENEEVNKYGQDDVSNEDYQNDSTENDNNEENEMNNENKEGAYYEEENAANEDEEEHEEEDEEDKEVEIERIEREIDLEPISTELPALPEEDDDDDDDKSEELSKEADAEEDDEDDGVAPEDLDDDDFLEDDTDEPPIEHITAHVGKPLVEVEEESSEKPPDTLAEEEEYEKQQEEKKREEEEKSSHMWLKLSVGGALLAATHAVVRRATAPREAPAEEERSEREETPLIDRRMTLIPEEPIPVPRIPSQSYAPPVAKEEFVKKAPVITQSPPSQDEEDEDDEEKEIEDEEIEVVPSVAEDKELYSDEEVEEEEEIEVKKELPKLSAPKPEEKVEDEPEAEDDDVEIIDEEQIDEDVEEEDDEEEEISDVDDAELLSRLEAKYGRLPEPERPGQKHKDGGNSFDDLWPGEPSDSFWRQELDSAEEELRRGSWSSASSRASVQALRSSARARWIVARAHDMRAEAQRDNKQLAVAIAAYLELLKMNDKLPDDKLKQVAERVLDRIMFRGTYLSAEPVYRLLIRRFPEEVSHRNNLTIAFLMANRADLAEEELKETLRKWPNDRVALAHYGFVLKTLRNRLEEAVTAFEKALEGDTGPANEPRFYYHLGDALLLLGKPAEAHEVHKRGAKLGHFLSPAQRSLYNVPRLKSKPWWNVDETPYARLAHALEKNWKDILKEGEAAKALYEKEKEGLKERGDWSQLDLFARGREIPNRCKNAPVTCSVVRSEPAAVGCRRGQIKFSSMAAGTHVRPHVGPTNCRLRMHLALSNTNNTFIRVDQTVRQWEVGKVLMFDDSFEHEVWHNGTGSRLVLIVDVWHPSLTPRERSDLPPI